MTQMNYIPPEVEKDSDTLAADSVHQKLNAILLAYMRFSEKYLVLCCGAGLSSENLLVGSR
jgi:hypothetical protein